MSDDPLHGTDRVVGIRPEAVQSILVCQDSSNEELTSVCLLDLENNGEASVGYKTTSMICSIRRLDFFMRFFLYVVSCQVSPRNFWALSTGISIIVGLALCSRVSGPEAGYRRKAR